MIHSPENFISDWKKIDTNDTLKILYVNQIGDNGVESSDKFHYTVWKNEKFTFTWKFFVKAGDLVIDTLFSRNV